MSIQKRLEKLEENIKPATQPWKAHMVLVDPGQSKADAVQKFKDEHEIAPGDEFSIFQLVDPKDSYGKAK